MTEAVVPGLRNSQFRYRSILELYVSQGVKWLDMGCGHDLIPDWIPLSREWQQNMADRARMLVGIDADLPSLRKHQVLHHKVLGLLVPLPFRDRSFSLITMNMVAEHLADPPAVLNEISRVLQENGFLIIHTPNKLSYRALCAMMIPQWVKLKLIKFFEARDESDVFPTYYRMNTGRQINAIAEQACLKLVELRYTETTPVAAVLGPLVLPELLFLKLLRLELFRKLRGDLIIILQKQHGVE